MTTFCFRRTSGTGLSGPTRMFQPCGLPSITAQISADLRVELRWLGAPA